MRRRAAAGLLVVPLLAGCGPGGGPGSADETTAPPDHRQQIAAWRAERLERLQAPDGWLSLVGLHWLREGANTFGSGAGNDLVFTTGNLPERAGIFHLEEGEVRLEPAPGVEILHQGEPVESPLVLGSDAQGEPTVLHHGSLSFYPIVRGERVGIRVKDSASPTFDEFEGIEHYPVEPRWRVKARLQPYEPPRQIPVPDILGMVIEQPSPGLLVFRLQGRELALEPLGDPGEELFIIFGDETNGEETYGGGRYLYADPPDGDGTVIVDFNKAYNPPCVFTPYATCPLPWAQNRLPIRVEAGEKVYGEH